VKCPRLGHDRAHVRDSLLTSVGRGLSGGVRLQSDVGPAPQPGRIWYVSKSYWIRTFGCRMNEHDSSIAAPSAAHDADHEDGG
jgi:hypothetical protein